MAKKMLVWIFAFLLLAISAFALSEDSLIMAADDNSPAEDTVLLQKIISQLRQDNVISQDYSTPYKINSEITKDFLHDKITIFIYKGQVVIIQGVNCTAEFNVKEITQSLSRLNLTSRIMISTAVQDDNLRTVFPELAGPVRIDIKIDSSFQGALKDDKILYYQDEYALLTGRGEKVGTLILDMYYDEPKDLADSWYSTLLSTGQLVTKTTFTQLADNKFDLLSELNYTGKIDINSGKIIFTVLPVNYKLIITLGEIKDEIIELDIGEPPAMIGTIKINASNMKFPDTPEPVEMQMQGRVYYADMVSLESGAVVCSHNSFKTGGQVANGKYSLIITEFHDTIATCYANGYAITKTIPETTMPIKVKQGTFDYDLVMAIPSGGSNYPDEDRDGVPDKDDACPGSKSTIVDAKGCDCNQKIRECAQIKMGCITENAIAKCAQTCSDGFQNQDETGIDCGGVCGLCEDPAKESCSPADFCISGQEPLWCDEQGYTALNCEECGCPEGYDCITPDQKCVRECQLSGLKCPDVDPEAGLDFEFYVRGKGFNCKSLGAEFEKFNHEKYFKLKIKTTGLAKLLEKLLKIKEKAEKEMEDATVCVRWEDRGCISPNAHCFSKDLIDEYKPEVQSLLQDEVNARIKGAKKELDRLSKILSIITLTWSKIKVDVDVDLSPVTQKNLEKNYACEPAIITSDLRCRKIIDNGPSDTKADLVFVGDQYYDIIPMMAEVLTIIDYKAQMTGTAQEGLFSVSPFKENREKFNVWAIPAQDRITRVKDQRGSWGFEPNEGDVMQILTACPEVDYAVVLSKTDAYRSSCTWTSVPPLCLVSLSGAPYPGRLTAHELGHGIGELADEYYTPLETADSINSIHGGLYAGPNCKLTQEEAEKAWGSLVGGPIGYFKSCGGDGGSEDAVRPTFISVMNKQELNCPEQPSSSGILQPRQDPACTYGAPFSPWYDVNARKIEEKLSKFS